MSVWAILACRAQSDRLYCKPLQRIGGRPILDHVVRNIRRIEGVDGIALAIADGRSNHCFLDFAEERQLPYIVGSEHDVLARVLTAIDRFGVDTMFRVTTECPFMFSDDAERTIADHLKLDRDFTTTLRLPLGTTFELLSARVLREMEATKNPRFRAPLSLYVHEHAATLAVATLTPPAECQRPEINLAVDHPGQLMFCQRAFVALARNSRPVAIRDLVRYYDSNPMISSLVTSIHESVSAVKADHTMARVWD